MLWENLTEKVNVHSPLTWCKTVILFPLNIFGSNPTVTEYICEFSREFLSKVALICWHTYVCVSKFDLGPLTHKDRIYEKRTTVLWFITVWFDSYLTELHFIFFLVAELRYSSFYCFQKTLQITFFDKQTSIQIR